MGDHVVDTNVLLVASHADEGSPFNDSHVPHQERSTVFEWLAAFRADTTRALVLDHEFKIYSEYKNKLTDQDYGFSVVVDKMRDALWVTVLYDGDGYAHVPKELAPLDNSDKKLAAAAIEAVGSTIVNACDTDWQEHEDALTTHGVVVEQLLPEWIAAEFERKKNRRR